jgi:hypothetical protein
MEKTRWGAKAMFLKAAHHPVREDGKWVGRRKIMRGRLGYFRSCVRALRNAAYESTFASKSFFGWNPTRKCCPAPVGGQADALFRKKCQEGRTWQINPFHQVRRPHLPDWKPVLGGTL